MVALTDVSVRFGDQLALDRFTGEFPAGQITALAGGDGAGKSTLLRALAGRIEGVTSPVPRARLGYQPATAGSWAALSVLQNLEFVARAYGVQTRDRLPELLHQADLWEARHRMAGRLSGGMRQKLAFLMATVHRPDLVLLDEPTTGVDPVSRGKLWELISAAAAEGAAVVLATTYLDEAERAGRLFFLADGTTLAHGAPDEVLAAMPGHLWRQTNPDHTTPARTHQWQRGRELYRWTSAEESAAPKGFRTAQPDLENASIAFQLAADTRETPAVDQLQTWRSRPSGAVLVETDQVQRHYGPVKAVDGVSMSVRAGEIVGLLGGNGAGKTTLMRVLLGLERPTAGQCSVFGGNPDRKTRRRIGYVAQGLGLYPNLSAVENLRFATRVQQVDASPGALELAQTYGSTPVGQLALGTRRVLAYLCATQHQPELLILDEPTSGMDPLARAQLWQAIRAASEAGTGILVTTHYMQEASQCDHLVMLASGRVVAEGSAEQIAAQHRSVQVRTDDWPAAFGLLRQAGLPSLLDGRLLRLPGADRAQVEEILGGLTSAVEVSEGPATLEETMMLG